MVTFYLDEDVSEDWVPLLRDRGHSAFTTREEGRKSAPDYRQLWFAATQNWTVLTLNRKDFIALHGAWLLWSHEWGVRPHHAGIVIVPQASPPEAGQVVARIHDLVRDPDKRLVNSLYEWRRAAGWVRSPRP